MKNLLLLIIPILLFSCSKKRESNLPRILVPEVDNVIEVNTKEMLQSQPPLLAMNFVNDTIIAKDIYSYFRNNINTIYCDSDTLKSRLGLKIIVDTSYNFYNKNFIFENLEYPVNINKDLEIKYSQGKIDLSQVHPYYKKKDSLNKIYVSSYPVLIYNSTDKPLRLNKARDSGFLRMIQEAQDVDGKWKPIEFFFNMNWCATGDTDFLIYPKKYLASAIIKYNGNFKTKIRVKVYSQNKYYYSNSFTGYINRSQFDQNFDKEFLRIRGYYNNEAEYITEKEWMFLKTKQYPVK